MNYWKMLCLAIMFFSFLTIMGCTSNKESINDLTSEGIQAATNPVKNTDISSDDFIVYGIKTGDSKETLVNKLGVPQNKTVKNGVTVYEYPKVFFMFSDEKINVIQSKDVEFKTKKGIGVGNSFEDIINNYKGFKIKGYPENSSLGFLVREVYIIDNKYSLAFYMTYRNREPIIESIQISEGPLKQSFLESLYDIESGEDWDYNLARKKINGSLVLNKDTITSAASGKLTGIKYGLGTPIKDIKDVLGPPEEEQYYNGGKYVLYNGCLYFYDGMEKMENKKTVASIMTSTKLSHQEIMNMLGKPTDETIEEDTVYITYKAGHFTLEFTKKNNEDEFIVQLYE
ncbi:hypothetical protein [Paenibacillus ginsengarvi]|uniref:DUF4309 domain-containing protein n=1 Tax=Paenibacillus ginsengarvi TaxID=400777 RepID=A0A3B0BRQ7_9BACL|nr:hypothetical protein [Paenibacillus ginsengarvi]RKN74899.1 hypothetical protein D7M11_26855 [Paenibacillus ginsengarvi]